jgi:hydrogenase maturation protein HypF
MLRRLKLDIQGTVQGIGFRPFIYNLAHEKNLNGYVANTGAGVDIEVEGDTEQLDIFIESIKSKTPSLAQITDIRTVDLPLKCDGEFIIKESAILENSVTAIPPDISICNDCLEELKDPGDRRHRYPFINCTNCGPRYTIIEDIPYDRPYTSMRTFTVCEACRKEYEDPLDRRFHAQPNACDACGPSIRLFDHHQKPVDTEAPIQFTADLLRKGHILAIKGLGGFHLAVDATNSHAVRKLRDRKNREEKPLALMALDLKCVRKFARVSPEEKALLTSPQRPIVLLKKKLPNTISPDVSPMNKYFGVMLPYTPLHHLLLENDLPVLVMTSGNFSKEPIAIKNDDALNKMDGIADFFLVHNRDIHMRADDSIVRYVDRQSRLIRRARGYVPAPVYLRKKPPEILACGAEQANTVCLTKEHHAIISQHIGDLTNLETLNAFQESISHLKRLFHIDPVALAHDLHPDYLSTQYALEKKDVEKIGVQHHHAHIVSCTTENGSEDTVIGLAFDGTGYGTDGRIWGGEVLLCRTDRFHRLGHMDYIPMPGGNAAVDAPWRMAVSYLYNAYGEGFWDLPLPLFKKVEKSKIQFVVEMISKSVNCPETSSMGRLFDGVSSILGIRHEVSYEAQAAISLEMCAGDTEEAPYPYDYEWVEGAYRISTIPIIRAIVEDLENNSNISTISRRFHQTLISLFQDLCITLREATGCNRVALSGGVFQNVILLSGLNMSLNKKGFDVFTHSKIPPNDGGISLGQAAVAAAIIRN